LEILDFFNFFFMIGQIFSDFFFVFHFFRLCCDDPEEKTLLENPSFMSKKSLEKWPKFRKIDIFWYFSFVNRAETRRHTRAEAKKIKIKNKTWPSDFILQAIGFPMNTRTSLWLFRNLPSLSRQKR
jgi:hypothetical protein